MSTIGHSQFSLFWDFFWIASVIGVWPRFIEPRLLKTSHLTYDFGRSHSDSSLKMVQISDLHLKFTTHQKFLERVLVKIQQEAPDVIVITGDFICNGIISNPSYLENFLTSLKAPFGVYAVLGNHDYNLGLNVNNEGYYDIVEPKTSIGLIGLKRLFSHTKLRKLSTEAAKKVYPHPELLEVFEKSQIGLLNNQTIQLADQLNLTGVGELMAEGINLEKAFKNYDSNIPGILLAHNPDAITRLTDFPPELMLSGHTHGGQINLPYLWKKFTAMENADFKSGFYKFMNKTVYINRGLGSTADFRFNTVPEIAVIQLKGLKR